MEDSKAQERKEREVVRLHKKYPSITGPLHFTHFRKIVIKRKLHKIYVISNFAPKFSTNSEFHQTTTKNANGPHFRPASTDYEPFPLASLTSALSLSFLIFLCCILRNCTEYVFCNVVGIWFILGCCRDSISGICVD